MTYFFERFCYTDPRNAIQARTPVGNLADNLRYLLVINLSQVGLDHEDGMGRMRSAGVVRLAVGGSARARGEGGSFRTRLEANRRKR